MTPMHSCFRTNGSADTAMTVRHRKGPGGRMIRLPGLTPRVVQLVVGAVCGVGSAGASPILVHGLTV